MPLPQPQPDEYKPLDPFRDNSELSQRLTHYVFRSLEDLAINYLPTRSAMRRAIRRWDRVITEIENYLTDWPMFEELNQARFFSPNEFLPHQSRMIMRSGKRVGETQIQVARIGPATLDLVGKRLQTLFGFDAIQPPEPVQMIALIVQYSSLVLNGKQVDWVTVFVAHVESVNVEEKLFLCSEILELGSKPLDDSGPIPENMPPSKPVQPTITLRTSDATTKGL